MTHDQTFQQALELHNKQIYHYFGIDKSWVEKVAYSESMTAQFDRADSINIVHVALDELMKIKFPRTAFRILSDESPENFIVAVLAFVDRMPVPHGQSSSDVLAAQKSPLIAFCAILIAGAAGDGKSQEVLDRIARRLPDDEKAQETIKNVDFSDNKVDWTQHMIDNIDQYVVPLDDDSKPTVH